jgi:ribosomal protein S18 acetylase RimI-like enzyme
MNHLQKLVGAFTDENLVGYVIYTKKVTIKRFAVKNDFRRLRIGQTLFDFVRNDLKDADITILNLDKKDRESVFFKQSRS